MKRKIISATILVVLIVSGIVGYNFYSGAFTLTPPTPEEQTAAEKSIEAAFTDESAPLSEKDKYLALFPDSLDEYTMQNKIHNMSHQKVHAEDKWGHVQITKAKVDRLLEVAKANTVNYSHEKKYIEILTRWSEGDFSKAVEDHNTIWKLQEGTIGEAQRLMTPVEELQYIEEHFKK